MSPRPEHEQFVAALAAGGSVLTPTTAPPPDALEEMRAFEATAAFTVPENTTVTETGYGGVDCLRLDAGGLGRTAIYFHGGGYVYTRAADALGAIAAMEAVPPTDGGPGLSSGTGIPLPGCGRRRGGGLPGAAG